MKLHAWLFVLKAVGTIVEYNYSKAVAWKERSPHFELCLVHSYITLQLYFVEIHSQHRAVDKFRVMQVGNAR